MVTTDIPEYLKPFEIPGRVTVLEGNGELPKIEVTTDWSTAEIYLQGAHVTEFRKHGDASLLFTSQCSRFEPQHPIRGGIPVILPWFGSREGMPAHGYARLTDWVLHEATTVPAGGVSLRFGLPQPAMAATGPSFSANYVVTVTDTLSLELIVTNRSGDQMLSFENCLHTYFAVGDIEAATVSGLKGVRYLDKVENFLAKTETADAIKFASEVDRIYLDTPHPTEILDPKLKRRIRIAKRGSLSTVVWNPWSTKAQQMPDLCNDDFRRMLCVESGNVASNKLNLAPGQSAVLQVALSSAPL
jgi:glucose-6-phosphate 1-epimerase